MKILGFFSKKIRKFFQKIWNWFWTSAVCLQVEDVRISTLRSFIEKKEDKNIYCSGTIKEANQESEISQPPSHSPSAVASKRQICDHQNSFSYESNTDRNDFSQRNNDSRRKRRHSNSYRNKKNDKFSEYLLVRNKIEPQVISKQSSTKNPTCSDSHSETSNNQPKIRATLFSSRGEKQRSLNSNTPIHPNSIILDKKQGSSLFENPSTPFWPSKNLRKNRKVIELLKSSQRTSLEGLSPVNITRTRPWT